MYKWSLVVLLFGISANGVAETYPEDLVDRAEIVSAARINVNVDECIGYGAMSRQEKQIECLKSEYKVADALLNNRYSNVISGLAHSLEVEKSAQARMRLASFRESQRRWINFRDQECDFFAVVNGRDREASTYYHMCMIDQTYQRANKISEYINCKGIFYHACPVAVG